MTGGGGGGGGGGGMKDIEKKLCAGHKHDMCKKIIKNQPWTMILLVYVGSIMI